MLVAFGIDIGAAAVKTAVVDDKNQVLLADYALHHGDIRGVVNSRFKLLDDKFGAGKLGFGAVTGSGQDFALGLAHALVRNFRVSVMKKLPMAFPVLFAGGVTLNQGIDRKNGGRRHRER